MARTAAERLRIYGPPERQEMIRQAGCIICGQSAELVHTKSGGTGRKADYASLVGMCRGHHHELHQHGSRTFEARYGVDLKALAELTEAAWQAANGELSLMES